MDGKNAVIKHVRVLNSNKGFTLIELIVVIVILAILMGIALPSLIGYINEAHATVCAANRSMFVRHYSIFTINPAKAGSVDSFLDEAEKNGLVRENICPADGECTFVVTEGVLVVTCDRHGSNEASDNNNGDLPPSPTRTISRFSTVEDALLNAEILYDEATKYWTDLLARHPDFKGVSSISATKQGSTANVNFWENGEKVTIYVENELSAIINPDKTVMGDVKVYLKLNPTTGKYDTVDYVAIKSGSTWAKYSPTKQETGTAANAWVPGEPPKIS